MEHDYTAYEYLPQCADRCGAITHWMYSKEMAKEVANNHAHQTGHQCTVLERMRETDLPQ